MKFDTLYKRTVTGSVQTWTMEVEGNKYRTHSGKLGGKIVTSEWKEAFAKNVGRANATTDEEQAMAEAQSRWDRQQEHHYHLKLEDCDKSSFTKPMLAHGYTSKTKLVFPVYSQPKLDGIRCLIDAEGMWTRGGKPIISAPHIFEAVKWIFDEHPDVVLDGEIYTHRLHDNFNKIISLAKKTKPKPEDLVESAKFLEFWMYDCIMDEPVEVRADFVYHTALLSVECIKSVGLDVCTDQEVMDSFYASYMENGYEGQMLRMAGSSYEDKRSKNLLKRKEFIDEEFEIVKLNEGKGNYAGMIKSLTLTDGTVTFESGIKGNQDFLKTLMADPDKWVGKQATCMYQNKTPDGIPRFPVVHVLHETERW